MQTRQRISRKMFNSQNALLWKSISQMSCVLEKMRLNIQFQSRRVIQINCVINEVEYGETQTIFNFRKFLDMPQTMQNTISDKFNVLLVHICREIWVNKSRRRWELILYYISFKKPFGSILDHSISGLIFRSFYYSVI